MSRDPTLCHQVYRMFNLHHVQCSFLPSPRVQVSHRRSASTAGANGPRLHCATSFLGPTAAAAVVAIADAAARRPCASPPPPRPRAAPRMRGVRPLAHPQPAAGCVERAHDILASPYVANNDLALVCFHILRWNACIGCIYPPPLGKSPGIRQLGLACCRVGLQCC